MEEVNRSCLTVAWCNAVAAFRLASRDITSLYFHSTGLQWQMLTKATHIFHPFYQLFFFCAAASSSSNQLSGEKKIWHYQNISPSFPFSGKMQKIKIPSTHEGFKYSVLVTLPQLPDAKRMIKGGLVLERCMIISCSGVWMCSVLCSCGVVLVTCVYRACMRPLPKHSLNPPCIKSLCCGKLCSCFHHVTNKDGTATDLFLHHLYPS